MHVTCHQWQQPQPQTLPLLTPPQCTESRKFCLGEQAIICCSKLKKNCPSLPQKEGFLIFAILGKPSLTGSPCSSGSRRRGKHTDGSCDLYTESAWWPIQLNHVSALLPSLVPAHLPGRPWLVALSSPGQDRRAHVLGQGRQGRATRVLGRLRTYVFISSFA